MTSVPEYLQEPPDAPPVLDPEHSDPSINTHGSHTLSPAAEQAAERGEEEAHSASDEGVADPLLVKNAKSVRVLGADDTSDPSADKGKRLSEERSAKASKIRTSRWQALGILWDMSTLERVRKCGRVPVLPGGCVGVRRKDEAVGYAGLATCGSVWACPRCSARIMAVRRLELGVLIAAAAAAGLTVVFGTVTLRHRQGQSLSMLWDAVTKGYRGVTNATKVKRMRKALGRVGYVRAFEVTYGGNGWHPHIHTLQLFEKGVTQDQLDELRDAEFAVWKRQAVNRGLGAPMKKRYELRKVADANVQFSDYFAKGVYDPSVPRASKSVGFEMTGSMTKKGRKGSRSPWQILEDFGQSGDLDDWDIWEQYEVASKGKRALVWSPGLKDRFGIGEQDDEEIADEEVGDRDDTLFWVTDWSVIAGQSHLGGQLLGEVQRGGLAAGLAFCRQHGIPTAVGSPDDDFEG